METPRAGSVEDMMLVHLECESGISFSIDVSWAYVGLEERWWFEVISSRGSARLSPLRVVKELNGRAVNVSPSGAAARESAFLQSYRAELTHFVAILKGDAQYEPPTDQLQVMDVMEAAYRSAGRGTRDRAVIRGLHARALTFTTRYRLSVQCRGSIWRRQCGSQPGATAVRSSRTDGGEPGSHLTVYLLTMGPGDQVWEKFGHNGIWIHDELNQHDIVYHWGLFDFADKDFVSQLSQGRMRYSMGAFDMNETIDQYRRSNRQCGHRSSIFNRHRSSGSRSSSRGTTDLKTASIHYDYFRDNCSTRVRDALDVALGGTIKSAIEAGSGTSLIVFTPRG